MSLLQKGEGEVVFGAWANRAICFEWGRLMETG